MKLILWLKPDVEISWSICCSLRWKKQSLCQSFVLLHNLAFKNNKLTWVLYAICYFKSMNWPLPRLTLRAPWSTDTWGHLKTFSRFHVFTSELITMVVIRQRHEVYWITVTSVAVLAAIPAQPQRLEHRSGWTRMVQNSFKFSKCSWIWPKRCWYKPNMGCGSQKS